MLVDKCMTLANMTGILHKNQAVGEGQCTQEDGGRGRGGHEKVPTRKDQVGAPALAPPQLLAVGRNLPAHAQGVPAFVL